jgi:hypothetical protein
MRSNGEIFIGAVDGKVYVFNVLRALSAELLPEATLIVNSALPSAPITSMCHLTVLARSIDTLVLVQGGCLHATIVPTMQSGQVELLSFIMTASGQAVLASECSGNEQQGIVNVQILEPSSDNSTLDSRYFRLF